MENKLKLSDIGYFGRPIDTLTKKELQFACLDLAQRLYSCASTNEHCKASSIESEK